MKSTGVTRGDGLSVSVNTRTAPEYTKLPYVLVIEVNIPFDTLRDFLESVTEESSG